MTWFKFHTPRRGTFNFNGGRWHQDLQNESLAFAGKALRIAYGQEAARQWAIATKPDADKDTQKAAKSIQERCNKRLDRVNTLHRLKSCLELAATGHNALSIKGTEWNANPWLIQAQDMVIDLKTGNARPGTPEDYINKGSDTKWEGAAKQIAEPVNWLMFLNSIFNGDKELIQYVKRLLGSALVGRPSVQEFYIFWGEGRNGKGTILETLKEILGEGLAAPIRSEMIMDTFQRNSNGPNPELLDLQGKRIVWASETSEGKKLNSEKVKLFTGGDTLSARLNYSNEIISFKPTHTLFMLTNNKPRISAQDTAVWDRLRLIPFSMRFVDNPEKENERKKDMNLQEKLLKEASSIFAWLVEGCLEWQKDGMNPPSIVLQSMQEYRLDEDPTQQFVNACCVTGEGYRARTQTLYDAFVEWFKELYGEHIKPISMKKFSNNLKRTYRRDENGRHTWFYGIGLADDSEDFL